LISLFGHLDTVPIQENGEPVVADGTMSGLGTSDMKSGLAVMIHLLEDDAVRSGPYDVVGVFYDKEEGPADENGLEEILDRAPWLAESEFAVVLEPTDLAVELGCNGAMNADVVFEGKAAHSARPWLGENAVTKAGVWLASMHERPPDPVVIDGLEFREVFSVTRAEGGIANNVLPSSLRINLNYRFPPVYTLEEAEQRLLDVAEDADWVVIKDRAPAGAVVSDNPHLDRLLATSGATRGAKQGWTDVARLSGRGIAAVNYGPGDPRLAHQQEESVELANVDWAFEALREFLIDGQRDSSEELADLLADDEG
jgi:succinyl-diaminopimelate desuccinylase